MCVEINLNMHERVTSEIDTPRKPMSTEAKPRQMLLHVNMFIQYKTSLYISKINFVLARSLKMFTG